MSLTIKLPENNGTMLLRGLKKGDAFVFAGMLGVYVVFEPARFDREEVSAVLLEANWCDKRSLSPDLPVQVVDLEISVRATGAPESAELNAAERLLVDLGYRIHAIKSYRSRLHCGLRDGKDAVSSYMATMNPPQTW